MSVETPSQEMPIPAPVRRSRTEGDPVRARSGGPRSATEGSPRTAPPRTNRSAAERRAHIERVLLICGAIVLALVALTLAERIGRRGRVLPGVTVAGVEVGGRTERVAYTQLRTVAARAQRTPVTVRVGGTSLTATPAQLGLRVDAPATVRAARIDGRAGGPVAQVGGFLLRHVRPDRLGLVVHVDEARLDAVLDEWVIRTGRGLRDGGLRFDGARVVEITPVQGIGISQAEARTAVLDAVAYARPGAITIVPRPVAPPVDAADVAAAAAQARRLLRAPVTLRAGDATVRLTAEQLASTLSARPGRHGLDLMIEPDRLRSVLGPALTGLEQPARDATWTTDGATATIVPAQDGRVLDVAGASARILAGRRDVTIGFRSQVPTRSTAWAAALGITRQVSTFTTSYPCCEPRVTNLHLAAQVIDGTVVEPGATFSLNRALGPRTAAKGYIPAPAIGADLELEDSVGGGVSQLSTTLFNAVFFGGYQDVTHTVHSLYISRYPMGREATLNYPSIDNKFRNDTHHGVLIRTSFTSTSITVSLYGDSGGRSVRAVGPTILQTIPPTTTEIDDPTLPAGTQQVVSAGATGYIVENDRVISEPGKPDVTQRFVEHYAMRPTKVARGPATAPTTPSPATPAGGGAATGGGPNAAAGAPTTTPAGPENETPATAPPPG